MCKVAESNGLYTYYRLHSISGESPNETAVWSKEGSLDESDLTGFTNKVASATSGNLAGLDSNGNLTDSGVASSDVVTLVDGKVPSSVLPSYVDDVIELLNVTDTAPSTCAKDDLYYNTSSKKIYTATATDTWGSTGVDPKKGRIYVNLADEKIYRWSGNAMVEISAGSAGGSGYDFHATITVTLQSVVNGVQTASTDINGAVITVTDSEDSSITYSKPWAGEMLTFDGLTPMKTYTITASNVTGYTTPTIASVTNIGIGVTVAKTAQYTASRSYIDLTMNCTIDNVTSSLPSGAKAYVSVDNGTAVEYTGASNTIQVDAGSDVEITFASVDNYQTPSTISISSASEGTIERSGTYAAATYTVNINTNQADNTAISAATVSMTFGSTSASYTGAQSNQTILVPANVTPATSNITASSVANYTASKTIDGTNILVQYQAEKVVVTLTNDSESTDDGGVVYCQNQTVTINGNTVTATETSTNVWQAIAYVAFGTEYSIVYGSAGTWKGNNDYTTPASVTNRTASQATYNVTGQYLMQRGTLYTFTVTDNQSGASGAASGCTLTLNYTDSNSVAHTETINYPTTTSFLVPNNSTNISLTGANKVVSGSGVFAASVSLSGTAYTVTYKATKLTISRTNGGGKIDISANNSTYSISQSSSSSSKTVYVKWGSSYSITGNVDTTNHKYPSSTSGMSGTANAKTASASITYSTYSLITSGYVDLGLPSGNKWAAANVGSSSYTADGTSYTWINALGQESGNHKLPSYNDMQEIFNNCKRVSATISDKNGYLYISKNNGKAIFHPQYYTWTC